MDKLNVFMIFPFDECFFKIFESIKMELGEKYNVVHAGDMDSGRKGNILKDIIVEIEKADLVIADMTDRNPNVFYELGLSHALKKNVLLISQDVTDIPFDLAPYRVEAYTDSYWDIKKLAEKVKTVLNNIENIDFGSPVSDFGSNNSLIVSEEEKDNVDKEGTLEYGIFDFLEEIENNMIDFTNEITTITGEQNEMNDIINKGSYDIQRINKISTNRKATLVRNVTIRIANGISSFSDKMEKHNENIERIWKIIEPNYINLIDNKYVQTEENKEGLKKSLISLLDLKNSISGANINIEQMLHSFVESKGMEKNLNKAIDSLEIQMNKYMSVMYFIDSSIDRIIAKSEPIVGKIVAE